MAKFFSRHTTRQKLKIDEDRLGAFERWLELRVTDSIAARAQLEASWRRYLAMYAAVPKTTTRDFPVPNAPNIEIPIGAIAADTIYAQAVDLIWSTLPLVTVRPKPKYRKDEWVNEAAQALQVFVNNLANDPNVGARQAADTVILDDVQLGTGIFYVPWVERVKKTKTAKVINRGPKIRAIPVEDVIVESGSRVSIDEMDIFGFQFYFNDSDLSDLERNNGVDVSGFHPLGARNAVRTARESLGKHSEGPEYKGEVYDVQLIFCYYDIDGDGLDEDLMVYYNHSSGKVGAVVYNPMDRRPAVRMVYQQQAHMFYGIGVMSMMEAFEEKLTDIHNYATLNMLLANSRVWLGDAHMPENLTIWPGKVINNAGNKDSLVPLQMADIYGSIAQEQMTLMQLANNRVGINDAVSPGNVPNRTPGITTMSMLQQVNRRFSPAFDSMRMGIADALMQCLYRYQERLLAGDTLVQQDIFEVVGYEQGDAIIEILQNEKFDDQIEVEMTAASAYRNAAADRQDAILLTNLLGSYYQRTLELASLAAQPSTPKEIREIALKIATAAGEAIERAVRTFDSVRDPQAFIIEVEEELNTLQEKSDVTNDVMQQLVAGLMGMQGQQPPTMEGGIDENMDANFDESG